MASQSPPTQVGYSLDQNRGAAPQSALSGVPQGWAPRAGRHTPREAVVRGRLASLDAYRGFIMLMMVSTGFGMAQMVKPDSSEFLKGLNEQFTHMPWEGLRFWDLIQPAFMFMVGVSMPFSYARRADRGDSWFRMFFHAVGRAIILVGLGVFLQTKASDSQTNFEFVNVLAQIGLGYVFLFLMWDRHSIVQLLAVAAILGGYWMAFENHPLPPEDFDYSLVAASVEEGSVYEGRFAHWTKGVNFAGDWDREYLNKLPRERPYEINSGGYQTLNFIPSLATMILGLMAGGVLRSPRSPGQKLRVLLLAGALCLLAGGIAGGGLEQVDDLTNGAIERLTNGSYRQLTVCPLVKRIWTPSWAVFSAGWSFLMLAGFYGVVDVIGFRWWSFPLIVIGMNSIVMYLMAQLMKGWTAGMLRVHVDSHLIGSRLYDWLGVENGQSILAASYAYQPVVQSVAVLFVFWLICLWLYRTRTFVRI